MTLTQLKLMTPAQLEKVLDELKLYLVYNWSVNIFSDPHNWSHVTRQVTVDMVFEVRMFPNSGTGDAYVIHISFPTGCPKLYLQGFARMNRLLDVSNPKLRRVANHARETYLVVRALDIPPVLAYFMFVYLMAVKDFKKIEWLKDVKPLCFKTIREVSHAKRKEDVG